MKKQDTASYRGYRTAGIRFLEDIDPILYQNREADERPHLQAYQEFDKAHVVTLVETGAIPLEIGKQILSALRKLEADGIETRVKIAGGMYSGENFLIRTLGEEVGGYEHLGRSSMEFMGVADRLRTRGNLLDLLERLGVFSETLLAFGEPEIATAIPLYLHWQKSETITIGHHISAQVGALLSDARRMRSAFGHVNLSPAGAMVASGSSYPITPERTAELLGFDGLVWNSLAAMGENDHGFEVLAALSIFAHHLSTLAEDLSVWSGSDQRILKTADRYLSGSSTLMQIALPMPQNYVKMLATALSTDFLGAFAGTLGSTGSALLNRGVVGQNTESAFARIFSALKLLEPFVAGSSIDRAACERLVDGAYVGGADLAALCVTRANISFRSAHQICGILFRIADAARLPARQITAKMVDDAAIEYFGKPLGLNDREVKDALNPQLYATRREMAGGSGPHEIARQYERARQELGALRRWVGERRAAIAAAAEKMERAIDALIGKDV